MFSCSPRIGSAPWYVSTGLPIKYNAHPVNPVLNLSTRAPEAPRSTAWLGTQISASVRRGTTRARSSVKASALFDRFTERAIKTVMLAQHEAKHLGYTEVGTEHILLGLISEEGSKNGFYGSNVSLEQGRDTVRRISGRQRQKVSSTSNELPFSRNAKSIFESALVASKRTGMNYIAPEHICIALMNLTNSGGLKVLSELGVQGSSIKAQATKRLRGDTDDAKKAKASKAPVTGRNGKLAIDQFCRDITAEAEKGHIDPVIGRETEVHRVCQILARRRKNNPILLGEPGVGKTAIAEGLAALIVNRGTINGAPLPAVLQDVRVMALDIGLLLAGAKERGELEKRVTSILAECKERRGTIVLVIDEIHTVVGAGSVGRGEGGGLDVANLIKPALAAGDLQCIGSTTLDEHRKYIERDTALARRFQPVIVSEPTPAEALHILTGLQARYEAHHRCAYTPAALKRAVELSHRYIADRFLPDKAIDVIDEAGSRAFILSSTAHSAAGASPPGDSVQYIELLQVMASKHEAVTGSHFEEAALLRERELDLKARLVGPADMATPVALVDVDDVDKIVALWTDIPIERMTQTESDKMLSLEPFLSSQVVGQSAAITAVTHAMQRARTGMKDAKRPIATLLFSGPTGVGKTCLTQRLAEHMFGSQDVLIRLDMSEYMERHSVAKLIGAPPGYVGYGDGGKLTEAVRRKPFSVILLDEIEKGHPDVFNILLQMIEDGRLTDSQGRSVSFKDCLIILTSNVGSNVIAGGAASMGFALDSFGDDDDTMQHARISSHVHDELKSYFRPEFLNRLDDIVVFNPLQDKDIRSVAQIMLNETIERVAALDVTLHISEAALDVVCATGFAIDQGARQLRRTIITMVEDPLSNALLQEHVIAGDDVVMNVSNGTIVVQMMDAADAEVGPDDASQGVELEGFPTASEVEELPVTVSASA